MRDIYGYKSHLYFRPSLAWHRHAKAYSIRNTHELKLATFSPMPAGTTDKRLFEKHAVKMRDFSESHQILVSLLVACISEISAARLFDLIIGAGRL